MRSVAFISTLLVLSPVARAEDEEAIVEPEPTGPVRMSSDRRDLPFESISTEELPVGQVKAAVIIDATDLRPDGDSMGSGEGTGRSQRLRDRDRVAEVDEAPPETSEDVEPVEEAADGDDEPPPPRRKAEKLLKFLGFEARALGHFTGSAQATKPYPTFLTNALTSVAVGLGGRKRLQAGLHAPAHAAHLVPLAESQDPMKGASENADARVEPPAGCTQARETHTIPGATVGVRWTP